MQALEFMHNEQNYLHRDLKPANVVIDKTFRVKIIDFGESRKFDPNQDLFNLLDVPKEEWS